MALLQTWKSFVESPHTDTSYTGEGALLIILYRGIYAQPILPIMQSEQKKASEIDWASYGFATDPEGKLLREHGIYLSKEMKKIKDWCEEHSLRYRWSTGFEDEPKLVDDLLEVHGNITPEAISSFPLSFKAMKSLK